MGKEKICYLKKLILVTIKTVLTLFALFWQTCFNYEKSILSQILRNQDIINIIWEIVLVLCFCLYYYFEEKNIKYKSIETIYSVIFAVLLIIGRSYSLYNSSNGILLQIKRMWITIFALVGWTLFFRVILYVIVEKIENYKWISKLKKTTYKKIFFTILICWAPYIIINYPGNVMHDGMYQLSMYFGYDKMMNCKTRFPFVKQ